MAQLPPIKRFVIEDYPSESSWIGALLYPLNLLLNSVYSNLNNGLTISQNMLAQITTVEILGATPTTSFLWKFSSNPVGLTVINVVQTNSPSAALVATVFCQFSYNAGVVTVTVIGLPGSGTYNVTFHVIGG